MYALEDEVEARLIRGGSFTDSELVYAATARCACGAGLAYPKNIGPHGAWMCSALLKGERATEDGIEHDPGRPFSVWEVKSERQPSAYGITTRPKV